MHQQWPKNSDNSSEITRRLSYTLHLNHNWGISYTDPQEHSFSALHWNGMSVHIQTLEHTQELATFVEWDSSVTPLHKHNEVLPIRTKWLLLPACLEHPWWMRCSAPSSPPSLHLETLWHTPVRRSPPKCSCFVPWPDAVLVDNSSWWALFCCSCPRSRLKNLSIPSPIQNSCKPSSTSPKA